MRFDFGSSFKHYLGEAAALFNFRGFIRDDRSIYPLGTDSKVLAAMFEAIVWEKLALLARDHGFKLEQPTEQNYYPDFTLTRTNTDGSLFRLAVDVKSTHGDESRQAFKFTLGSYTGCIHPARETKNILYPYSSYAEHWVVGFVYQREDTQTRTLDLYPSDSLASVPLPLKNVRYFVQEKWRIAGDKPGSGNTSNIGSIEASLAAFDDGAGVFSSDAEFLAYWRNYNPTGAARQYRNIAGYHAWRREQIGFIDDAIDNPPQYGLFERAYTPGA